jgi:hypothetical protein
MQGPVDSADYGSQPANRHKAVVGTQTKNTDLEFDVCTACIVLSTDAHLHNSAVGPCRLCGTATCIHTRLNSKVHDARRGGDRVTDVKITESTSLLAACVK